MCRIGTRSLRPAAQPAKVALPPTLIALICGVAAAQAAPSLLHPPILPLESQRPTIAGDVNGDGHVDLVGVHQYPSPRLDVYLGDGLGGFAPSVSTAVPIVPLQLAGGDFDHDGRMDVAFLLGITVNVEVLFSAGDGSFVDPVTLPLAATGSGQDLTLCDATGDGNLDLVGAYVNNGPFPSTRLTLFAGTGDGGFTSPPGQVLALDNPAFVTHGDFDGDGDADLLAANPFDTVVAWGHGDGAFDPPELLAGITAIMPEGTSSWVSKTTGDLDGDGRDDIACVEHDGALESLSWKPGAGFTGTPIESDLFDTPLAGAIADLARDGHAELLLAYNDHIIEILKPEGAQGWTVTGRYGTTDYPLSLHAVDVDEDGGLDVVSAGFFLGGPPGTATLLSGQGDGLLQNVYRLDKRPLDVAVADMTGDGFADVVAVLGAGKPAQLLAGRFDGGLDQPQSIDVGPQADRVFLVDATGDGVLDLLTAGGTSIAVAAGHGNGSFDPPVFSPVSESILDAQVAAFGGDALPDLALLLKDPPSYYAHHVHFLINAGGVFTDVGSTLVTPPDTDANRFEVADLDRDQDTDLIVKWNSGYVRVFLNQPTGFEPGALVSMNGTLLGVADYDLDGHVDIADARDGGFEILSGDGAGGITPIPYPTPGLSPLSLVLADLDGDGLLDRVVGGSLGFLAKDDLWVALGLHGGAFAPYSTWSTASAGVFLQPIDVNGDGAIDLVTFMSDGQVMVIANGEGPWSHLGHSLAGAAGWSRLQGFGTLTPGSPVTVRVSNGQPGSPAMLIAGMGTLSAPFKGGVLVPQPTLLVPLGTLDAKGQRDVSGPWPASMPQDASYALQVWRIEPGAPSGVAATTAIQGMTP